MKASFNQNDLGLYPTDNEFIHDCEGCLFLYNITSNSYRCRLMDFGTIFLETFPHCFKSKFTSKPLSDVFKL